MNMVDAVQHEIINRHPSMINQIVLDESGDEIIINDLQTEDIVDEIISEVDSFLLNRFEGLIEEFEYTVVYEYNFMTIHPVLKEVKEH